MDPMSVKEYETRIDEAENDFRLGKVFSHDEVKNRFKVGKTGSKSNCQRSL
jgi:hypothetical protein